MIKIEEFWKIDFKVGEVEEISKSNIKIKCDNKTFNVNLKLDVKKKDKIAIIIEGDKLIIPVVNGKTPLVPEKDIEVGSKIR